MNEIEAQVENLIDLAKDLVNRSDLSDFMVCPYHGRARGKYFNIEVGEVENRIRLSVYEGFNVELYQSISQLIICVWEYPGPKPEKEYAVNLIDIPSFVKDLDGE
jgi:uncharacterized protein (DUF427 family)